MPWTWGSWPSEVDGEGWYRHTFTLQDASSYGVGLLWCDAVPQSPELRYPGPRREQVHTAYSIVSRLGPSGLVQSFGTPIIHSTNDGSTICLPDGFSVRPVKPYPSPSK